MSTRITLLGRLRDLRDATAWTEFHNLYRPRVYAWCRQKGLQAADAEDVTQNVLLRVASRMQTFVYTEGGNFSGWLHQVWQNAWLDFVEDRKARCANGANGSGDSALWRWLQEQQGGDLTKELDRDLFERELVQEAMCRVQAQVSPCHWRIIQDFLAGKSGTEIAAAHGMTLAAAGMVKLRVQRRIRKEIEALDGPEELPRRA